MSWTRLDDLWTEQPIFESVSLSARWHYLAMIQACSRTERVDGRLSARAARRCSDVDDPDTALVELAAVRLIVTEGEDYRLPLIGDHVPPPSVREASKRGKERMRRHRAHRAGDHTMCLPANCPEASAVAGEVTGNTSNADENRGEHARDVAADVARNTGTGRDGTGRGRHLWGAQLRASQVRTLGRSGCCAQSAATRCHVT